MQMNGNQFNDNQINENQIDTDALRKKAKQRVMMRRSLAWHAVMYVLVNAFLMGVYAVTTPGGYFWPVWSILGWGLGVLCHGASVWFTLRSPGGTQDEIEREYQRLLRGAEDGGRRN